MGAGVKKDIEVNTRENVARCGERCREKCKRTVRRCIKRNLARDPAGSLAADLGIIWQQFSSRFSGRSRKLWKDCDEKRFLIGIARNLLVLLVSIITRD